MILIIDFGSQYNQLIARRVRECNVFSHIKPHDVTIEYIKSINPEGIILSGGPSSIYEAESPKIHESIFDLNVPILGICYGMHFIINALGGAVKKAKKSEYGFAMLNIQNQEDLFKGIDKKTRCWMSHGDSIEKLPDGFVSTAYTSNTQIAATKHAKRKIYGLQFHPEVHHTVAGTKMLDNFISNICGCKKLWNIKSFAKESMEKIKEKVKEKNVILGLSGGVDSTVAATLIHKAIGNNLRCIFVDNGLLRKNEASNLQNSLKRLVKLNIQFVNAEEKFLTALEDVVDPEEKRKIIGKIFIEVFEKEAKKIDNALFFAQGTLYPDIIESVSAFGGPTSVIKSHHNVGGLPENMKLELIEPLKYLFKDEVRKLGKELEVPEEILWRQPFPGPGLAIRIIGKINQKRLSILRKADEILIQEIKNNGFYKKLWQSFAVLLPIKSVGVMGDKRTYENIIAVRAVESKDAMTADWARLPHDLLATISNRIINEVNGVNKVVYDISSKPPSTIEWE